jgi:hypothetical protein
MKAPSVARIRESLLLPPGHESLPSLSASKGREQVRRKVPLKIVQIVRHDLVAMIITPRRSMVDYCIKWMLAFTASHGRPGLGVEEKRRVRELAEAALPRDKLKPVVLRLSVLP